jgi:hypothetical protein
MRKLVLFAVALSASLALVCTAGAQTASINGTVTDSTGALVQHAKVTALNTATNLARSTETGSAGVYSLTELVPGPYNVTIEKASFRTVRFAAVTLTVDQTATLNAKLEVGSAQEQVTVEGAAVPVDTADAQLSSVIEHTQMTELPLILRDPYQLVLLSPGVTQSDNMGGISTNGGRERNNNFMLDGADNNDTEVPGGLGGITSQNPDSTEEFRIITNNFAPEYGRNNGSVIDVITRSGSNSLHGDAFYFGRWDALGARDFFNHQLEPDGQVAPKNPYVRNLYGGSIGGPIVKDKTFFFVNYQGDRFVTNLTNTSVVPTAVFTSGNFTYTNLATGASQAISLTTPGAGNNGTGVGLDPVMQKILALYPAPSSLTGDGVSGTLFFPSESREKDEDATLKIDQKITKGNTLSGRYIYNWFHDPNPFHLDFLPIDGGLGAVSEYARTQAISLQLTSNPSPTLVNVARASTNRNNAGFGCTGTGVFDSLGFIDGVGRGADYNLPGYTGFGCLSLGDSNAQGRKTGTYQYMDTLTKVVGKHTTKFGAEFRDIYSNNFTSFASRALFDFNTFSGFGASSLQGINAAVDTTFLEDNSSMLLGMVASQAQTQFFDRSGGREYNDELDFRSHELGLFAQDEFKALPNLTLTYGLRWEYYGVPYDTHGRMSNLFQDPSGPAPALTGGGNGFTFTPVGSGTGQQLFQNYYRNFEPRVGFAWDPFKTGKTSIRGGIGAFSDRVYGNLISDARGNPPFQPSVFNTPVATLGTVTQAQLQNQPPPAPLGLNPVVQDGAGIFPDLFAQNIRPPSVVTWNFGIQRQITSHVTLEANYVGNHGTRILRVEDGNPPQPALVAAQLAAGTPPEDLQFANLYFGPTAAVNNSAFYHAFVDQTSGHSWYDGLQSKLDVRNFHGLQMGVSYTWSHALDDSSDPLPGADTNGNGDFPVDTFLPNHEFGNSGFDTRQRLVLNFVYQPNIGRGKSFLSNGAVGRVFEGWEVAGIASFQTGLPYDIFGPEDTLHTGGPNGVTDRATVVDPSVLRTVPATGKIGPGGGVFTGFNVNAFNQETDPATTPWGIPANVVRNNWYGPGVNNWNISLAKTTALTERVKFQLRFETYNLFNRVQFQKPTFQGGSAYGATNYTSNPDFGYSYQQVGQNDGTTGARQIQFGAKFTF